MVFPAVESSLTLAEAGKLFEDVSIRHGQNDIALLTCFLEYAKSVQEKLNEVGQNMWVELGRDSLVILNDCHAQLVSRKEDFMLVHEATAILATSYAIKSASTLQYMARHATELSANDVIHHRRTDSDRLLFKMLYQSVFSCWLVQDQLSAHESTRDITHSAIAYGLSKILPRFPLGVKWMKVVSEKGFEKSVTTSVMDGKLSLIQTGVPLPNGQHSMSISRLH